VPVYAAIWIFVLTAFWLALAAPRTGLVNIV
jgi:hypothetical protein